MESTKKKIARLQRLISHREEVKKAELEMHNLIQNIGILNVLRLYKKGVTTIYDK